MLQEVCSNNYCTNRSGKAKWFWKMSEFTLAFVGSRPFAVLGPPPTGCMKMIGCLAYLVAWTRMIPSLTTYSVQYYGNLPGKFVLLRSAAPFLAVCVLTPPLRTNFAGLPLLLAFVHACKNDSDCFIAPAHPNIPLIVQSRAVGFARSICAVVM